MSKTDEYAAKRVREILLEEMVRDERVQALVDRDSKPTSDLRSRILISNRAIIAGLVLSCGVSWIAPWGITWFLDRFADISSSSLDIVFWITLTISTSLVTAQYFIASVGENSVHWAKQHESASRTAKSLLQLFEGLDASLPNSVPDLSRYENFDIDETAPVVQAALRGANQKT